MKNKTTTAAGETMTEKQEASYQFHKGIGWEFSHWDGDDVVVELWQQDTMESRSLFATVRINPDGGHKCIENAEALESPDTQPPTTR